MNSVERLLHYSNELEQEAAFDIDENKPPSNWPEKGEMQFKNVQLRYRPGLPLVLKGLTMHVAGGEKIGVVGRTGAGKSSLMQAIFRIVELAEGSITIDGHDISKIGLNDLRSRVSIIPQDALLFSGSESLMDFVPGLSIDPSKLTGCSSLPPPTSTSNESRSIRTKRRCHFVGRFAKGIPRR